MKAVDTAKRNKHYRCLEYDHDQTGDICLVACGMERCDPGVNFGPCAQAARSFTRISDRCSS